MKHICRVGLFGIGLDAYWPQFKGLKPRLEGYVRTAHKKLERPDVEVVNLGLIDNPVKALAAGHKFRAADVDMIFLHVTTYALSSTVLPVVQRAKVPVVILNLVPAAAIDYSKFNALGDRTAMTGEWLAHCAACPVAATRFFDIASALNIGITLMVFPFDDMDVMTNLATVCQFCGRQVEYVIVRNPARASKNRMFDSSPLEKELLDCGAACITVLVLSEFVKLRLARLEADHQRGIPFNEAIGNDSLGLEIMARGVLQDWLATMFNQYDQLAAKLLPTVEAAGIKPKIVPPIGEPVAIKRGAKVNLTN